MSIRISASSLYANELSGIDHQRPDHHPDEYGSRKLVMEMIAQAFRQARGEAHPIGGESRAKCAADAVEWIYSPKFERWGELLGIDVEAARSALHKDVQSSRAKLGRAGVLERDRIRHAERRERMMAERVS